MPGIVQRAFQIVTPLIKRKETGSQRQGHVQTQPGFNTLRDFPTAPKPPQSHPTKGMESGQEKPLTSISQTVPCKILETPICPFTYIVNSIPGAPSICSIMNKSRLEPCPPPRLCVPQVNRHPKPFLRLDATPPGKAAFSTPTQSSPGPLVF